MSAIRTFLIYLGLFPPVCMILLFVAIGGDIQKETPASVGSALAFAYLLGFVPSFFAALADYFLRRYYLSSLGIVLPFLFLLALIKAAFPLASVAGPLAIPAILAAFICWAIVRISWTEVRHFRLSHFRLPPLHRIRLPRMFAKED